MSMKKLLDFQQYYIQYIHACVQNLTHEAMWCVMAPNKKECLKIALPNNVHMILWWFNGDQGNHILCTYSAGPLLQMRINSFL